MTSSGCSISIVGSTNDTNLVLHSANGVVNDTAGVAGVAGVVGHPKPDNNPYTMIDDRVLNTLVCYKNITGESAKIFNDNFLKGKWETELELYTVTEEDIAEGVIGHPKYDIISCFVLCLYRVCTVFATAMCGTVCCTLD